MPGVTFNGTSQYLSNTGISSVPSAATGGETIFVVATWTGTASTTYAILGPSSRSGGSGNGPRGFIVEASSGVNSIRLIRYGTSGPSGAISGVSSNVPFLAASVNDGANASNRLNGTAGSSTATAFAYTTSPTSWIGAVGATASNYFRGTLHEILVYGWLHSNDVPRVEGYLAAKWGLQALLPVGHPFASTVPFAGLFYPTAFSSCAVWFDALDASTFTLSGSSVIQWNDKSGANRHASNGVSPTLSTTGVVFNGTTHYLATPCTSVPTVSAGETIFAVVTRTGGVSLPRAILGATDNNGRALVLSGSTTVQAQWFQSTGGLFGNSNTSNSNVPLNTRVLITAVYGGGGTGSASAALNGMEQPTATGAITMSGTGTSYLGATFSDSITRFFPGVIHELIVYSNANTTPSITTTKDLVAYRRLRVEAYLAAKWGLKPSVLTSNSAHVARITPTPGISGYLL
jgi:hypothetical protein